MIVQLTKYAAYLNKAAALIFVLLVSSCTLVNPISNEVRAGGTVMVMVNGVRHDMPQPADFTCEFNDLDGPPTHTCIVKDLIRVNADPTSLQGFGRGTHIPAYQGQLLALVQMPPHNEYKVIKTGEGTLTLTNNNDNTSRDHTLHIFAHNTVDLPPTPSNPLSDTYYPDGSGTWSMSHWVNIRSMPHVILQTTASNYDDINTNVAGATFVVSRVDADWSGSSSDDWGVTKLVQDPNLQLSWEIQPSGTEEGVSNIYIHLMNPHGFYKQTNEPYAARPKSLFIDLSAVAIAWWDDAVESGGGSKAYTGTAYDPFTFVDATYYDIEGNEITGLSMDPVRQH